MVALNQLLARQIPRRTAHLTVIVGTPVNIHVMPHDWDTLEQHPWEVITECQQLARDYRTPVLLSIQDKPPIEFKPE